MQIADPARRLGVCSAVVVIAFALLAGRVAQLQLFSGDKYQKLAVEQALHTVPISAERGSVFDRNGRDLAMSVRRTTIYADPTLIDDPVATAAKLAPIVQIPEATLVARFSDRGTAKSPRRFAYVARTVRDDVAQRVTDLDLPGIGFVPESARSYPAGAVAGALIGHVGTDGYGLDGAENVYNSVLTGKAGSFVVERDPKGHEIPNTEKTRTDAQRGTDVVLTVDEDMQWEAEYALLDQVKATDANGGMAAVVDLTNGDVVAMASVVGATATGPARVARAGELNAPLTQLFEPGSTNKLITLSWAIEHGHVTPDSKFNVPNFIRVAEQTGKPYSDAESHQTADKTGIEHWTTADILRESSNVGTIMIAQKMKNQEVADGLRAFGLGRTTAITWPAQPAGILLDPAKYYATGKYSSAIGYGVSVTGMQMLDAFTTIANGGVSVPPRLLDATIDSRGKRHAAPTRAGSRVVSANTAATMTRMLQGVIAAGTGACAAVPGYTVAGKTGTAKKASGGGYSSSSTMASFIGYAPADHPRFATLVVLDEKNLSYGGAVAAPVFSEIMQYALPQYGVAPNDPADTQYQQAQVTAQHAGNSCVVPHGDELANSIAARQLAAQRAAQQQAGQAQSPTAGTKPGTAKVPADPSQHT